MYVQANIIQEVLPKGRSLSCTPFLLFINDLPKNLKAQETLYVDDLSFWQTQNKAGTSAILLKQDLEVLQITAKIETKNVFHKGR